MFEDVPQEHLIAIGRVSLAASFLDLQLFLAARRVRANPKHTYAFDAMRKSTAWSEFQKVVDQTKSPELLALQSKAKPLRETRNQYVHSLVVSIGVQHLMDPHQWPTPVPLPTLEEYDRLIHKMEALGWEATGPRLPD